LLTGEPVISCSAEGSGVRIDTARRTIRAGHAIVAAGSWLGSLFPELELPLTIERQLLHWFCPSSEPERHSASGCPLSLWEFEPDRVFATFPDLGGGVKCGVHHEGEILPAPESV